MTMTGRLTRDDAEVVVMSTIAAPSPAGELQRLHDLGLHRDVQRRGGSSAMITSGRWPWRSRSRRAGACRPTARAVVSRRCAGSDAHDLEQLGAGPAPRLPTLLCAAPLGHLVATE